MKTLSQNFVAWFFSDLLSDPLYQAMMVTSEASSWHREATVAAHTNMVMAEYIERVGARRQINDWKKTDLNGAFAAAFHDVGKPSARTEAFSEERGTYYRYGGHELISARLWEDWAVRNWPMLNADFGLTTCDMCNITWMIENHRPWGIKRTDKRDQLVNSAAFLMDRGMAFMDMLLADNIGRISDNYTVNINTSIDWVEQFKTDVYLARGFNEYRAITDAPVLYIAVGAPGSGKSTFFNSAQFTEVLARNDTTRDELLYYSWDALRLEWYDQDDYANAYRLACEDNKFTGRANSEFVRMTKTGKSIYADNTNSRSKKRRGVFIRDARKQGYQVIAIVFPIALQDVIDRQTTRTDKYVPVSAVRQHYMSLSMPFYGEVDGIEIYNGNLLK